MNDKPTSWADLLRRGARPGQADPRAPLLAAALAALGLAGALGWAALHRGPWYDEFFTWFVTRPDRGFAEALRGSWLADNHPPLFNALAWAGAHLAGSIEQLRWLNLAALGAALAGGWVLLRRTPQWWTLAAVLLLVLSANETLLRSGAELRSYFFSLCAGAVAVLALAIGWLEGRLAGREQRAVLWAALLAGFNLHILTSVILGALVLPFVLAAWLAGRRALLRQLLAPAMTGSALFIAVALIQLPHWHSNTASFWIPGGLGDAWRAIEYAVLRAGLANGLALVAALGGAALLVRQAWTERRLPAHLQAMALLAAGTLLAAALLIGLHLLRPVVTERFLAALVPAVALGMALGADAALRRMPAQAGTALLLAACALSLWALAGNARHTVQRNSWEGSAARVAMLVHACPDTPVHIDPPSWNAFTMALPPADNRMVFGAAHALMARRHHFSLEPTASRRISGRCPTLFWAEHDTRREWDEAAILARLRARGFAVQHIWQQRIGDGWIASNRPLDGGAAAR